MAKAGMKLHKCKHSHEANDGKVLDVHWCSAADEVSVNQGQLLDPPDAGTRRNLPQHVASI